jgi:hypothetical protein
MLLSPHFSSNNNSQPALPIDEDPLHQLLELTTTGSRPMVGLDSNQYYSGYASLVTRSVRVCMFHLLASFLLLLLLLLRQEINRVSRFSIFENDLREISH